MKGGGGDAPPSLYNNADCVSHTVLLGGFGLNIKIPQPSINRLTYLLIWILPSAGWGIVPCSRIAEISNCRK